MMNEPVSLIMTTNLITIHPDVKYSAAKELLEKKHMHHLPVTKNGFLEGLVSSNDLYRFPDAISNIETLVSEVMVSKLVTLEADAKVGTAAEIFLQNLFHCIPIVDGKKLVGIITTFDILKYSYHKEYPNSWWIKKQTQSLST